MFHALALVKIEDGGAEHFLEALLQVALIDSHLAAQLLNGERLADVLQKNFPGPDDLFPVGFIGQELTLESFHFFFSYHTFQAIQQQHLALGIDEDVLHAIGVAMVEKGLQHQAGPSAKREYLGKGGRMTEIQDILAKRTLRLTGPSELREMNG